MTPIGVLGAGSLVADGLLPRLRDRGPVVTLSRRDDPGRAPSEPVPDWVSLAPIWGVPELFGRLEAHGVRHIVALSSTSVLTKASAGDPGEQAVAARLAAGEQRLIAWAEPRGIAWTILRPTLIWGHGRDGNVSRIAAIVRRVGAFPVLGEAAGRRQPIHADDVATACLAALAAPAAAGHVYAITGGETLRYRDMVERVFAALGRTPRIVSVPLPLIRAGIALARWLPGGADLTPGMAERMNRDLVFDASPAANDFGFAARGVAPRAAGMLPGVSGRRRGTGP
ncbi:NAD-dependent epimerase/dehydratase family protein [Rhodoplanes sp. TEM]|uniref:NAD-dependent epimerase/dehydratase family protein n=1 Tax=Rhodoplanes sp. TEM TaxID=3025489 RepID=UPI0023507D9C|nr:NAD-dependent epimerase/dehydratase family protein [Rhodoplanes sp. TEM]MDC7986371.1 NAD-dependent epimerase/dehydratase family protein [Rhodoplanes sp. TEM]